MVEVLPLSRHGSRCDPATGHAQFAQLVHVIGKLCHPQASQALQATAFDRQRECRRRDFHRIEDQCHLQPPTAGQTRNLVLCAGPSTGQGRQYHVCAGRRQTVRKSQRLSERDLGLAGSQGLCMAMRQHPAQRRHLRIARCRRQRPGTRGFCDDKADGSSAAHGLPTHHSKMLRSPHRAKRVCRSPHHSGPEVGDEQRDIVPILVQRPDMRPTSPRSCRSIKSPRVIPSHVGTDFAEVHATALLARGDRSGPPCGFGPRAAGRSVSQREQLIGIQSNALRQLPSRSHHGRTSRSASAISERPFRPSLTTFQSATRRCPSASHAKASTSSGSP